MATAHLHFQTRPIKHNRRRRRRETTITASADNPAAVDLQIPPLSMESNTSVAVHGGTLDQFTKFNSALTAGLLSPPPPSEKTRSSPTLFEMMASETDCHPKIAVSTTVAPNGIVSAFPPNQQPSSKFVSNSNPSLPVQDKQALLQQRLMDCLQSRSPGNQFNDAISGDVKLTLTSVDGIHVSINVHRQILAAHSSFFALKLNEKSGPSVVEIADCDDVEVYMETIRLMYCRDLRKKLMKDDVPRVLAILKVSAAIGFDAGVLSCLEYLEAAPWPEDEEDNVAALLSELKLEGVRVGEVLKRVSVDVKLGSGKRNSNEEVLLKLLHAVLDGKDEKARREMKNLVTKMLRENSSRTELRKESLYSACDMCLKSLRVCFLNAAEGNTEDAAQIVRQADNLHWLLDILIDRQVAEDFLTTWGSETELSEAHSKVAAAHRHEVSRVTARLFVGIGKGQLLASKEARCSLLQTWLVPFYDDFKWMRRAGKGLDRHLVEEGLSNTILTLPMMWQQDVLMGWFDRFLNSGDDCPNIQRAFAVWWRRAFWTRNGGSERNGRMRIMEEKL